MEEISIPFVFHTLSAVECLLSSKDIVSIFGLQFH